MCINPTWVETCKTLLRGHPVKVCTVIGFPLGSTPREVKALEARRAIRDGARELERRQSLRQDLTGDVETDFAVGAHWELLDAELRGNLVAVAAHAGLVVLGGDFTLAFGSLVDGQVVNEIVVPDEQKKWAKIALDRMLAIK